MTVLRQVDRARRLLQRGRCQEARELLRQAATRSPSRAGEWIQIGLGYLELGSPEEAGQAFARARERDPRNPAAPLFAALAAMDQRAWEEASRLLAEARRLCPANQALPTAEATLDLERGRSGKALQFLAPEEGRADLFVSPYLLGRLAVAVERELIPREQLPRPGCLEIAPLTGPEKEPGGAARRRGGGLSRIPRTLRAWRAREEATRRIQRAFGRRPEEAAEELDLALQALRRARELDPRLYRLHFHLAEALLLRAELIEEPEPRRQMLEEAWELLEESRTTEGENPYLNHYRARAAYLLGVVERAAGLYRSTVARFEKFPEAHYGLGQCLLIQGQEREARRAFLRAVTSDLHLLRERLRELRRRAGGNKWETKSPAGGARIDAGEARRPPSGAKLKG